MIHRLGATNSDGVKDIYYSALITEQANAFCKLQLY
jgi:hypothetical protein